MVKELVHVWVVHADVQKALRAFALKIQSGKVQVYWEALQQAIGHFKHRKSQLILLMRQVAHKWYAGVKAQVFKTWRHYFQLQVFCKKFQIATGQQVLRRKFLYWKKTTAYSTHLQKMATKVMDSFVAYLRGKAFTSWKRYTDHYIEVRTFLKQILDNGLRHRLARWKAYAERKNTAFVIDAAAKQHRRRHLLKFMLHAWKLFCMMSQMLSKKQDITVRKLFLRWVSWYDKKKCARAKLDTLAKLRSNLKCQVDWVQICYTRWHHLDTMVCFDHWVKQLHMSKMFSTSRKLGFSQHLFSWMRQAFLSWRHVTLLRQKALRAMERFRDRERALAFSTWCAGVDYQVGLREKSRSILVFLAASTLEANFHAWKREVYSSQCVLFMLQHRGDRLLSKALGEWKVRSALFAIQRHHHLSARCHWAVALILRTLSDWSDWLHARKIKLRYGEIMFCNLNNVRLRNNLQAWQHITLRRERLRTHALATMRFHYTSRYFTAWLRVAMHCVELRCKAVGAMRHFHCNLLQKWCEFVRLSARHRMVSDAFWARIVAKQFFAPWRDRVSWARMKRGIQIESDIRKRTKILREFIVTWCHTAKMLRMYRKTISKFDPDFTAFRMQVAFLNYRKAIGVKHHRAQQRVMAAAHFNNRTASLWFWHNRKHLHARRHSTMFVKAMTFRHFIDALRFRLQLKLWAVSMTANTNHWLYLLVWDPLVAHHRHKMCGKANGVLADRFHISQRFMRWRIGIVMDQLQFSWDRRDQQLHRDVHKWVIGGEKQRVRDTVLTRNIVSRWRFLSVINYFGRWKTFLDHRRSIYDRMATFDRGVLCRSYKAWLLCVHAQIIYREALLNLTAVEGKLAQRSMLLQSRAIKNTFRFWGHTSHRRGKLRAAYCNTLRRVSGYRFFYRWAKTTVRINLHWKAKQFVQAHYTMRLQIRALKMWKFSVGVAHHTRLTLTMFGGSHHFLKKKMAFETWLVYCSLKHAVQEHRAKVMKHKRVSHVLASNAINLFTFRSYWRKRKKWYEQCRTGTASGSPFALWNMGLSPAVAKPGRDGGPKVTLSDGHIASLHHSESSRQSMSSEPRLSQLREREHSLSMSSLPSEGATALSSSGLAMQTQIPSSPSGVLVNKVLKDEFKEDMEEVVRAFKRTDAILLVDMWMERRKAHIFRDVFRHWAYYMRLYSHWNTRKDAWGPSRRHLGDADGCISLVNWRLGVSFHVKNAYEHEAMHAAADSEPSRPKRLAQGHGIVKGTSLYSLTTINQEKYRRKTTQLKQDLDLQTMSEVRSRAMMLGATQLELDQAERSDNARDGVIELIIERNPALTRLLEVHEQPYRGQLWLVFQTWEIFKLGSRIRKALMPHALRISVQPAARIGHFAALAFAGCENTTAEAAAKSAALTQELRLLSRPELKERAREVGAEASAMVAAEQSGDPSAALVELILAAVDRRREDIASRIRQAYVVAAMRSWRAAALAAKKRWFSIVNTVDGRYQLQVRRFQRRHFRGWRQITRAEMLAFVLAERQAPVMLRRAFRAWRARWHRRCDSP
jgi:hypothetical protein